MNEIFDTAVIDSNFFIALVETGIEKQILPILQKDIPIECTMPFELPRSDIPTRFRELRQMLVSTEYVKGIKVNRDSKFWKWTSELATKQHYIRANDDPADIDVVVLARLLEKQKGKKVVVVSNDEGVVRTLKEVTEFQNISTMSAGSFLFTLSALVNDEKISSALTEGGDKLYNQYLSYRRKSRKFIDIKSLVSELRETSVFVRKAATLSSSGSKIDIQKINEIVETESQSLSMDEFQEVITIINRIRSYKESYNLMGGEEYLYSIIQKFGDILSNASSSENYQIMLSMYYGQMYEFRTWALETRLRTGGVYEALIHAENLLQTMIFLKVNKEIIEDILALQSLLMLLNGRKIQALSISKQIPIEEEMSSVQLMALFCSFIAQEYDDDKNKAGKMFLEYTYEKKIIDLRGIIESILKFSNTAFLFGNYDLAIQLNKFIIKLLGKKEPNLLEGVAQRLFLLTRINPILLDDVCIDVLNQILTPEQLQDNSAKKISPAIKKATLSESEDGPFHGMVTILAKERPFDKPTEFHILGFEENTKSVWRIIMPIDYSPSLSEALGFRLKGGQIMKIISQSSTDPTNLRGTIIVNNPAIQVDMQVHW